MFHKILVGIDGEGGGLDAAALARKLVAPDGELVLVHIDVGYPMPARGASGDFEHVRRARSLAVLEQACAQTGIQSYLSHASTSVGHGLQALVERESADLVVVGATRRGPAARIFIGDDTRGTLRAVRGAVAVAPAGYADSSTEISTVGIAYDGSSESRSAAAVARDLSAALDAELAAIEVVDVPMYLLYSGRGREGVPARDALTLASNQIAGPGRFEPSVRFGYVDEQLLRASRALDLLVMGSRSAGFVRRLLHGNTSEDLARSAQCALLVLTEPACEAYTTEGLVDEPAPINV